MDIGALFSLVSSQGGVPVPGSAPAGFAQLMAQLLAAGGPEPPGAPPGEVTPCGEKLTTPEPNAQSIQPDSAPGTSEANFDAQLLSAFGATGSKVHQPANATPPALVDFAAHAPKLEVIGVPLPVPELSLSEQAMLQSLIGQRDFGVQMVRIERSLVAPMAQMTVGPAAESRAISMEFAPTGQINQLPQNVPPLVQPQSTQPPDHAMSPGAPAVQLTATPAPKQTDSAPLNLAVAVGEDFAPGSEFSSDTSSEFQQERRQASDLPNERSSAVAAAPFTLLNTRPESIASMAHRPQLETSRLVRDLADRIEMAMAGRTRETMTIEFRPMDIGNIKVMLTHENDQVNARILTDNENVRQAMHAVQPEMRASLEHRGIQLGTFSVGDFASQSDARESSRQPMPQPTAAPRETGRDLAPAASPASWSTSSTVDYSI